VCEPVVTIDPELVTGLSLRVETYALVDYSICVRDSGRVWCEIGPHESDRRREHQWLLQPPFPAAGQVEYALLVWGHPDHEWRVRLGIEQLSRNGAGGWAGRARWREQGVLDENGWAEVRVVIPFVSAVVAANAGAQPHVEGRDAVA
jgi:hypothetical protein